MSSLAITAVVFACTVAGTIAGMTLRAALPRAHLSGDTHDLVKLSMGLLGTLTALVLGLLIASAKGSFDTQRNGLAQLAGQVIMLDRTLARYGPESKEARDLLRASVTDLLERTWPGEGSGPGQTAAKTGTEGRYEGLYERIQELAPKNDAQRTLQAQALKAALDMGQMRWVLFAQKGSSIPAPFLIVLACWLALLLTSFSLFAPPNATVFATLLICALAVSSAIFLILELDRPFDGIIQISSDPVRRALMQLGR